MFKLNSPLALATGLEGLSKVHGAKGITTSFQGTGASTNYKHINLPALPMMAEISKADMAVYRGYHGHEVGHIIFTNKADYYNHITKMFGDADRQTYEYSVRSYIPIYDCDKINRKIKVFHRIWNFLEDPCMEKKVARKFGGLPLALTAVVERVVSKSNNMRVEGARDRPEYDARETLLFALNLTYRMNIGIGSHEAQEYLDNIPDEIKPVYDHYLPKVMKLTNTKSACELAELIMSDLWSDKDFEPQEKETGDGQDEQSGDTGSDGDDDGDDGSDAENTQDEQGDDVEGTETGKGSSTDDDDADDDGTESSQSSEGQAESEDEDPEERNEVLSKSKSAGTSFDPYEVQDLSDAVEDIASEAQSFSSGRTEADGLSYERNTFNLHRKEDFDGKMTRLLVKNMPKRKDKNGFNVYDDNGRCVYVDNYDEALKQISDRWHSNLTGDDRRAIAQLARKLQSRQRDLTERSKPRGRLDPSRLSQVIAGDTNVFYTKQQSAGYSTAVSLSCDMSGSVDERRMSDAMLALNEALGMGNIPTQISTWHAGGKYNSQGRGSYKNNECCAFVLKEFHENYRNVREELMMAQVSPFCGGGTYAVEPYWFAIQELLQRQEQRKILFFLQDGDSAGGKNGWSASRACKKTQIVAKALGIETIAIGIGWDGIRYYFDNSIYADFNTLAADLLDELGKYFDRQGFSEVA